MRSERSEVGIVGYGASQYDKQPQKQEFDYLADAARAALASAGLAKNDVDGLHLSSSTLPPDNAVTTAEYLGLTLRWAHVSACTSAGAVAGVAAAVDAVASGAAKCVLCLAGGAQSRALFAKRIAGFNQAIRDYVVPHGFGGMNAMFAIIQRKHMETYGTTREQLARIPVDLRANAVQNDAALFRSPLTVQDYLEAPVIADPIRLYDCVLPCSGAEAVVVAPLERGPAGKGVRIAASGECHNYPPGEVAPLRFGWETFRESLYAEAGYGPSEMDFIQVYDDYPIMAAIQLEDLGFCAKGDVGKFLAGNTFTWQGTLPLNTGGGQLSCGQSGAGGGLLAVVEAVRQLRGEGSRRQVKNATRGLVAGYGQVTYGHGLSTTAIIVEGAKAS